MNSRKYKEIRLGDIFIKLSIKKADKFNLRKKPSATYSVPVVYAKFGNNGIIYWGKKNTFPTCKNVISIVYNGVISAGKVYAHERETGILAESYFIALKEDIDISFEANLYMAIMIEKAIYPKYSRDNLATWDKKVENEIIQLPVCEYTEEIDYEYMRKYIILLKEKYKNKIAKLFQNMCLDNYSLTENEQNALLYKPRLKQYKMGDIFIKLKSSYKGNGRKQDNVSRVRTKEFSLPLINCKDGNNGVMYYGRENDYTVHKNVLSIIYNGPPTEGQTYYQEKIGLYTDAYIIGLRKGYIPCREVGIYLATAINKSIHNLDKKKYSRGNKATWENKVENDYIALPIDKNENIDWNYMENYIKAIEKQLVSKINV